MRLVMVRLDIRPNYIGLDLVVVELMAIYTHNHVIICFAFIYPKGLFFTN